VLQGTLTLRLGDDVVEVPAGSYGVVPPGNVHTFANSSDGTVRALNLMAPGGFEQYLKEVGRAGTTDPAEMAKIASRYDFQPVV
jgi:mannose-6-phosphate isomerase-like protein (cupin superfamily)